MNGFDGFLGNDKLISRLKSDIGNNRMSHAYIIEGAPGTGRRTLARLICAAVSCADADRPCMKCRTCDLILRGQSPDVITVERERDRVQLGVDVIRRLREDAVYAAGELPCKFYLIPDADVMNVQAQNALLKILEEPPTAVMFLLLCENADNLLPTIRSRAPSLRISALSDEAVSSWLLANDEAARALHEKDEQTFRVTVRMAGGSIGRARQLADPEKAEACMALWSRAERFLSLLANRRNSADELAFYEHAAKLSTKRDELDEIFALIADGLRDLAAAKLTSAGSGAFRPLFYTDEESARALSERFALGRLLRLSELVGEARASLARNVNVSLTQVRLAMSAGGQA
ncbi:MAG: hypothetical protein IJ493_07920 [Clostridia bacterium]|nr:hypothetical protein [Clostridia bacterium]